MATGPRRMGRWTGQFDFVPVKCYLYRYKMEFIPSLCQSHERDDRRVYIEPGGTGRRRVPSGLPAMSTVRSSLWRFLLLASDAGRHITGITLVVEGHAKRDYTFFR